MFGFTTKKKKQKQTELDESFERVMTEIARIDDWENPKRLQHYILDSCEQIIATTKVIEKEKAEYTVLNNYLKDVKKITSMPERQAQLMRDVIKNLKEAKKAKEGYENVTHRLTEEQFLLVDANINFIKDDIRQMQENEVYQDSVRRDMKVLEATKSEHEIERINAREEKRLMKSLQIGVFAVCAVLFGIFTFIHYQTDIDTTWASLIMFLVTVLVILYIFFRNSRMTRVNRQALVGLNKTISLLNVVRMKYANVTSSIRYLQNKYSVKSSYELNWLLDSYNEEMRIREQNEQDNEDYRYFYGRLIKILNDLDLRDRKLWMDQQDALSDPAQLKSVSDKLRSKRRLVRSNIEENTRKVQSERDEVSRLMREHDYYPPEIVEIIGSVDRMCGLNVNYHFRDIK